MIKRSGSDILSPTKSIIIAAIREPIITCPSPPQFQNFILNAGVRASEIPRRIAVSLKSTHIRSELPKAPSNIEANSVKGFSFDKMNIINDIITKDERIAAPLIKRERLKLILLRFVI
jgi:hypothetical protein